MRHESNQTLAVVLAAAALALSPLPAAAEAGGKKGADHGKAEAAPGHGHDHAGHDHGGIRTAIAPKKDAPPQLPQDPS